MTPEEAALLDDVLAGQLDIFRLGARKRTEILRRLAKMEKELIDRLATQNLASREKKRLNRFLKEADQIIKDGYTQVQAQLELEQVAETVANITADSLTVVLGVDAVALPLADYYASVASDVILQGVPQATWWARQAESTRMAFEGAIRQGLASAETNQQLVQRIVGKGGVGGVMQVPRRNAAALVQTSVSGVANNARLATFKRNGDIVKGVKQVSTLDSHTSDICIAYSGASWDLEGKPILGNKLAFNGGPPRHFNCRSVLVPILKTNKELGLDVPEIKASTRASDEGQISAKTTFDSFLKRKGQSYQDEVLGVGRADLWREGKITLRDLVSGDGRPLTLRELRQKAGLD